MIKRAAAVSKRLEETEQYWRKHAVLIVEGPGRSGRGERVLHAGDSTELKIWVVNEGDKPIRGHLSLARETSEGYWYGPILESPGEMDRQPFEVQPGELTAVTFSIAAKEDAPTRNVTFRTKTYLETGQHDIVLDPTRIDLIVVGKPEASG